MLPLARAEGLRYVELFVRLPSAARIGRHAGVRKHN
jgi:hypothetical protein